MNTQETKRIEKAVEMAVVKALRSKIRTVVRKAVHEAFASEDQEDMELDASANTATTADSANGDQHVEHIETRFMERQERNGILSPAPGGICWAIWVDLDALKEKGKVNFKELEKISKRKKWNWNSARTEYYRWHRFHDIPLN